MRRSRGTGSDRRLRAAGAVLILAGIALTAGASGAFGAASADRGLSVAVAADADSYLGIRDDTAASGSTLSFGSGESVTLFSLTDNAGAFNGGTTDQVSARLVAFGGDTATDLAVRVSTASGDPDWQVAIECGEETRDLASGYATVEVTAVGGVAVVAERTTDQQVTPNCAS